MEITRVGVWQMVIFCDNIAGYIILLMNKLC